MLSTYQKIIHHRTYARENGSRLEFFNESVDRYIDFLKEKATNNNPILLKQLEKASELFKAQKIAGSMRLLYSAGKAAEAENAMAFNCKYQHCDSVKDFADLLYSLLCTCGVGFGLRKKHVNQLPDLPRRIESSNMVHVVEDTRYGWAHALHLLIDNLYQGRTILFDTKNIRPHGAKLETSGGFASGPEPLIKLRDYIVSLFIKRSVGNYKKLKPIDCCDIACMIAQCAVQGGVRRAAIICFFDEDDDEMLYAKTPEELKKYPHRYNSNNTMVYSGNKERLKEVFEQIKINGEPGILFEKNFNARLKLLGREYEKGYGANPCFEILQRDNSFCNLTEAILKDTDTLEDDKEKVRYATFLGLLQATLTDYNFITEEAKHNQESDPIIGVSLTGICDVERYWDLNSEAYKVLKEVVSETVDMYWKLAGLKVKPKAVTCVKPSGTVSQLMNCSSGVHPRYGKYYLRRILVDENKKLCDILVKMGIPWKQMEGSKLFTFAFKSPEKSLCIDDCDSKRQLDMVEKIMNEWCDHNVSSTVYVRENEWDYVYERLSSEDHPFIGLSFLPESIAKDVSGFLYLPFEKISKEEFEKFPKINSSKWEKLMQHCDDDQESSREFACVGGSCHIS